ncbi:MAG: hypothetical protein Fur0015_10120 [Ignavibacteriales bacterium]
MNFRKLFLVLVIFTTGTSFAQEILSKGKFSGYMFGDYFYNAQRDERIDLMKNVANVGKKDFNGFQFRRIYFTYDYTISEKFSSRFRLEADQAANTNNGKIGVAVKDAYLNWKNVLPGNDIIFGLQPTPAYEISERLWGNRFLEKTILDLRGIVSSRDLGISAKGKLTGDGLLKYWIMIGNNSSNAPETDKYKRFYVHLQFSPTKNLSATIYADLKSRKEIVSSLDSKVKLSNNDLTYSLFVGYKEDNQFSAGFEIFQNKRLNDFVINNKYFNRDQLGFSVFGTYNFKTDLALVFRYDYFNPNLHKDFKGDSRNYFVFGMNYKADEKVIISPNLLIETYEKIPGQNDFITSVTPRITFYYYFL